MHMYLPKQVDRPKLRDVCFPVQCFNGLWRLLVRLRHVPVLLLDVHGGCKLQRPRNGGHRQHAHWVHLLVPSTVERQFRLRRVCEPMERSELRPVPSVRECVEELRGLR